MSEINITFTKVTPTHVYNNHSQVGIKANIDYDAGQSNVKKTLLNFDETEASKFNGIDSSILLNGAICMQSSITADMTDLGQIGTGQMFVSLLTSFMIKTIEKVEVI
ncbi:hypothetical protein [Anaerospora hongkongensis]|uniref:hypothetical protein n=1 Tax=Anaerospora hongkongensis TaxID=244830 RepID=UPI00289E33B9|nr:hypothetical protein [Anaerospora hongkongensis]